MQDFVEALPYHENDARSQPEITACGNRRPDLTRMIERCGGGLVENFGARSRAVRPRIGATERQPRVFTALMTETKRRLRARHERRFALIGSS
jgi:hypothetical protein